MEFDIYSKQVIGSAIEVHRELDPGLLESTYERCLFYELKRQGIQCIAQKPLPIKYKGMRLDCGYRVDLWVENALIVELKSADSLQRIHMAQLLTYMKMANVKTGLLINFNVDLLKKGIKRVVL